MPSRRSRDSAHAPVMRRSGHDRHGRGLRSSVTGPYLPPLFTRIDLFDMVVSSTADYLRSLWPAELSNVTFEVAPLPTGAQSDAGVERWHVDPATRRVTLFRLPIQRMSRLHRNDDLHRRMMIESCVFRAVAELLGKDPWDLAPERFRH